MSSEPYAIKVENLLDNWQGKEFQVPRTQKWELITDAGSQDTVSQDTGGYYVNDYTAYGHEYLVVRDAPKPPNLVDILLHESQSWLSPINGGEATDLAIAAIAAGFHHESECAK